MISASQSGDPSTVNLIGYLPGRSVVANGARPNCFPLQEMSAPGGLEASVTTTAASAFRAAAGALVGYPVIIRAGSTRAGNITAGGWAVTATGAACAGTLATGAVLTRMTDGGSISVETVLGGSRRGGSRRGGGSRTRSETSPAPLDKPSIVEVCQSLPILASTQIPRNQRFGSDRTKPVSNRCISGTFLVSSWIDVGASDVFLARPNLELGARSPGQCFQASSPDFWRVSPLFYRADKTRRLLAPRLSFDRSGQIRLEFGRRFTGLSSCSLDSVSSAAWT